MIYHRIIRKKMKVMNITNMNTKSLTSAKMVLQSQIARTPII